MKKQFSCLLILISSLLSISLLSCDTNDTYYSPLLGTWELSYDQSGDIDPRSPYIDKYAFYQDGTGSYGWYDSYGYWQTLAFLWTEYQGSYVKLIFANGSSSSAYFRSRGRNLEFSQSPNFFQYNGYIWVSGRSSERAMTKE